LINKKTHGGGVRNVLAAPHGTKTLKGSWQQEVEIANVIAELAERLSGDGQVG
jgi:hypothetical protein